MSIHAAMPSSIGGASHYCSTLGLALSSVHKVTWCGRLNRREAPGLCTACAVRDGFEETPQLTDGDCVCRASGDVKREFTINLLWPELYIYTHATTYICVYCIWCGGGVFIMAITMSDDLFSPLTSHSLIVPSMLSIV